MNAILRTLRAYAADAREAFRVAPVEVLHGVVIATLFSLEARDLIPDEVFVRVLVALWLSFCPLLAFTVLHLRGAIRRQTRVAASALVLLAAGTYALTVFQEASGEAWRVACLMLAGIFFLLLTPAVPPRVGDRLSHWRFAFGILGRTMAVAAYAGVIFASMAGAVASVVNLFELRQPDHLYQDLAGWMFFAAAPWILVGGVARLLDEPDRPGPTAPLAVVRFGRFIYAPVVVVYLCILYAYGLKVLATQELPKNLVSPLVLGAGLLGMAGALLLEPVHADREQRGLSLLVRWLPALLLPLLPFAYAAILMRQGQYGWTEFRYLRLAGTVMLTVVAVLGAVWVARRRMPPLASVPGILALGLLVVSIGPWSAQAVSRRDQSARLRRTLREARIATPVRLGRGDSITVTVAQRDAIQDGIYYLGDAHGMGALQAVLGPEVKHYHNYGEVASALALRTECRPGDSWSLAALVPDSSGVTVGAGRLAEFAIGTRSYQGRTFGVTAEVAGTRLRLAGGGWSSDVELAPLVRRLSGSIRNGCAPGGAYSASETQVALPAARYPLRDGAGAARGELILTGVQLHADSGRVSVAGASGFVVTP